MKSNGQANQELGITAEKIADLISREDDFAHEMRVGKIIQDFKLPSNFSYSYFSTDLLFLEHGGTYTDNVTNKPRQYDYRAAIAQKTGFNQKRCFALVVECKNISSPLIICGRERLENEAYYSFITSTMVGVSLQCDFGQVKQGNTLYPVNDFVGKSLVRLKGKDGAWSKDSDEDIYNRWSQALASSVEMIERAALFADEFHEQNFKTVVLPLVVVPDEILWQVFYDQDGTVRETKSVESSDFFVERVIAIPQLKKKHICQTHVRFLTVTGLVNFLNRLRHDVSYWNSIFDRNS